VRAGGGGPSDLRSAHPSLADGVRADPASERETVLGVIERDGNWCRVVEQTAETTGITVRANPRASLYLHVLNPAVSR